MTPFKPGWLKDKPDARDYAFRAKLRTTPYTPVDLRPNAAAIIDQGNLGSCTACATTKMVEFVRKKQNLPAFSPSVLFTYYTTRQIEGTVNFDNGAYVRNALKSAVQYGVVSNATWPYLVEKFKIKPATKVYTEALKYQALEYRRIADGDLASMQQCLADGYPFMFGALVYTSFLSTMVARTGIVPYPVPSKKEKMEGGHCMLCVGWKLINEQPYFIIQNSWGKGWGDKGFCYIPCDYLNNKSLASDFWTITLEEKLNNKA